MGVLLKYVQLAPTLPLIEAMQGPHGEQGAAIRALCRLLTISSPTQILRIRRNPDLAMALHYFTIDTPGGPQSMAMLESWAIAVWVGSLHTSRLSPESQEIALLLKRQAYAAIQRAFAQQTTETTPQPPATEIPTPDAFQKIIEGITELRRDFLTSQQRLAALEQAQAPARYQSGAGLSAYHIGQIFLQLRLVRDRTGIPIAEAETRLATHLGVAHIADLDEQYWGELEAMIEHLLQKRNEA